MINWIHVESENKPEHGKKYLVFGKFQNVFNYNTVWLDWAKGEYSNGEFLVNDTSFIEATHWAEITNP